MTAKRTILVLGDIHYAGPEEQRRRGHESRAVANPLLRLLLKLWRHFFWLRDPFAHNHLLDRVLRQPTPVDYVISLGDLSCDSAFVGVSDDAACHSAQACLDKLRQRFGPRFYAAIGDHELGKMSFFGGQGGMRLASWRRVQSELGLEAFWQFEIGRYLLVGVTSSLIAWPVFEPEARPEEREAWRRLSAAHRERIRRAFTALKPEQRILLFCHDPTALPFLWQDEAIRARLPQVEQTIIGHLHTRVIFWKSRVLAGMPTIRWLGNSARRMSTALNQAKCWRPFKVRLCPALTGCQLLKDGGYYLLKLDDDAQTHVQFEFHRLPWRETALDSGASGNRRRGE
jgi:hypothetical protein